MSLLITPLNALEKMDCSGLKKISKAFIACKSGNFRAGVVNTGNSIKKNTIGKIKETNKVKNDSNKIKETKKVKKIDKKTTTKKNVASTEKVKASTKKLKKFWKNFKKSTKQYPKGTK
jgi:hypothetical protein